MQAAGNYWLRGAGIWWARVEPTKGARNWSALSSQEAELKNAAARNMPVTVIMQGTPAWAQLHPPYECGAIKRENFADFANLMREMVARYSVPPFNVRYFEIWNEEDIDLVVSPDSPFGCWGDPADNDFGGGYYADMLKVLYPQMKAANAQVQVVVGGLLLDCDPVNPPVSKDCKPARFFEGILRNGGASFFDGVSYHAYDYYGGSVGVYGNGNWHSAYNTTGPVSIAKARYLQSLLAQYAVRGKFLMNTELALLCDTCSNDPVYEMSKAYYLVEAYAAAIAEGLRANIWFSLLGWRNSGLLDDRLNPRPAYHAFKFARSELRDVILMGELKNYSGLMGYEFDRGDRRIWLLWSLDGVPRSIGLPGLPLAVWDALGNPIPPAAAITIDFKPVYLEWNP